MTTRRRGAADRSRTARSSPLPSGRPTSISASSGSWASNSAMASRVVRAEVGLKPSALSASSATMATSASSSTSNARTTASAVGRGLSRAGDKLTQDRATGESPAREHPVRDERVVAPFGAEGRDRPVARHEGDVIAQRPQLAGDGGDQVGVVAAREIRPADRAAEQHVADLGEARLAVEEHYMARGVARTVDNLPGRLAEGRRVAVAQPAVGDEAARLGQAVGLALGLDAVDPELVVGMRPLDRDAGAGLQLGRGAGVIQVAVGDPDAVQRQAAPLDLAQHLIKAAARVDDGGPIGL